MVEIDDIKDRESFKAWLDALPKETDAEQAKSRSIMVALAARCAARVLPLFWNWSLYKDEEHKDRHSVFQALRTLLILSVASHVTTENIINAAVAAVNGDTSYAEAKAYLDDRDIVILDDGRHVNIAYAAANATLIAGYVLANETVDYAIANAVDAAEYTFAACSRAVLEYPAFNDSGVWSAIRYDCLNSHSATNLFDNKLWAESSVTLTDSWPDLKRRVLKQENDWRFWVEWYESLLAGNPMDFGLLTKIALIEPDIWDQGEAVVNPIIQEMWLDHYVASTPNAEDVIISERSLYDRIPRSDLPAKTLQDARDRIADVIANIERVRDQNQYSGLGIEGELLGDILARYPDNALRLYEVCSKVVRHVGNHIVNGVLPEGENVVGDVMGDLQNTADDIYNFDPNVKETIDSRDQLKPTRLSDEEKVAIDALGHAVSDTSEPDLAKEIEEDVELVNDAGAKADDQVEGRYRLGSRLVRIYRLGGENLKKVAAKIATIGGVYGGVAAIWQIILWLLS